MKGERKNEKKKITQQRLNPESKRAGTSYDGVMKFTPLDLFPLEPTPENVIKYLADTYWIESQCISIMGKNNQLLDDTIQYIYICIIDRIDRLINIYESRGILAFCGYIKQVINIQARYQKDVKQCVYGRLKTVGMSLQMEHAIDEQYNPEIDEIYHLK